MDALEAVRERRSVRDYTSEDVDDAMVRTILEAGRMAPSGLNNQPWRFRVLRGGEKGSIAGYTKYGGIVKKAPVCIAVFFDEPSGYDRTKDMQAVGACIQNMLLAAHSLGLGGAWLGEILKRRADVERTLGVRHELMAVIALGHPAEAGGDPDRKSLDELIV